MITGKSRNRSVERSFSSTSAPLRLGRFRSQQHGSRRFLPNLATGVFNPLDRFFSVIHDLKFYVHAGLANGLSNEEDVGGRYLLSRGP